MHCETISVTIAAREKIHSEVISITMPIKCHIPSVLILVRIMYIMLN